MSTQIKVANLLTAIRTLQYPVQKQVEMHKDENGRKVTAKRVVKRKEDVSEGKTQKEVRSIGSDSLKGRIDRMIDAPFLIRFILPRINLLYLPGPFRTAFYCFSRLSIHFKVSNAATLWLTVGWSYVSFTING